jgi:hypothetical protein
VKLAILLKTIDELNEIPIKVTISFPILFFTKNEKNQPLILYGKIKHSVYKQILSKKQL